jgi:ribosomal protein L21
VIDNSYGTKLLKRATLLACRNQVLVHSPGAVLLHKRKERIQVFRAKMRTAHPKRMGFRCPEDGIFPSLM